MIKNSRIAFHLQTEEDMWQSVKFMVGVQTNIKACQTIFNGDRNDVSFQGGDTMKSTRNKDRLIIAIIPIPFKLARGMNGSTFAEQGILVHDSNDGAVLGLYNTSNSANTNIVDMMIVNTLDINVRLVRKIIQTSSPPTPPLAPQSMGDMAWARSASCFVTKYSICVLLTRRVEDLDITRRISPGGR
jgi:hypothetical protein